MRRKLAVSSGQVTYDQRRAWRRRTQLKNLWIIGVLLLVIYWAAVGTEVNPSAFIKGLPLMVDFVGRAIPPDLTVLPRLGWRTVETVAIALLGTTFATIIAFPLGFLASRNVTPNVFLYQGLRSIIDVCRGISEIVWAFLMVTAVGLGPFSGVLALTIHTTGALGKYFSETVEHIDPGIIEAVTATGSNKIQVVARGVFPELRPLFTNYSFYYLENNIRQATILGLVGAGGLGYEFIVSIKHLNYPAALTIMLVMLLLVSATDRTSAFIRKRLVAI